MPSVHSFGVVLLGLGGFKHINDLYNREFGDEVLRITSQRIPTLPPSNASLFRLDGDEFGMLVANSSDEEILKLYGRIRDCFNRHREYNGQK